jgi:hypothetical protein
MNRGSPQAHAGFTLIETLIYLGLYTILIGGMLAAVYSMIESDAHNETVAMLEEEGDYLIGKIDWVLSDTATVQAPFSSGGTLTVTRFDGSSASISVLGASLRVRDGGASPQTLNNSDVSLAGVVFVHTQAQNDGIDPESVAASFTMRATTSDGHVVSRDFSTLRYLRQ